VIIKVICIKLDIYFYFLPNEIIAFFQIPSRKYNLQFNIIYSLRDGLDGIDRNL